MIFLHYQAAPNPDTEAAREFGGAYVNAWVDVDVPDEADTWAREEISDAGWTVVEHVETRCPDPNDSAIPAEARQYVQEAVEDGMSLVFYSWPLGADDE